MNNTRYIFYIIATITLIISCKKRKEKHLEIMYFVTDSTPSSAATYTVYSNITDKSDSLILINFADSLINGKHPLSAVGFFYNKEDVPKVNKDHSIEMDKGDTSIFAIYRFNEKTNSFKLEWNDVNLLKLKKRNNMH